MKTKALLTCALVAMSFNAWAQFEYALPRVATAYYYEPEMAVPADLDGDGDQDLIVFGFEGQLLLWFEQEDGLFDPDFHVIDHRYDGNYAADVADVDQDGDLDVVVTAFTSSLYLYLNDGGGNFDDPILLDDTLVWGYDLQTADLNNDGWMDIVACSPHGDYIRIYLNQQNGTFGTGQTIFDFESVYLGQIQVVDLNGDNNLDIFFSMSWDQLVMLGDGTGVFTEPTYLDLNGLYMQRPFALGDLDGDGDLDVVAEHENDDSEVYAAFNDGNGVFSLPVLIAQLSQDIEHLTLADIDGDQHLDVVYCARAWNDVLYLPGNGDGGFANPVVLSENISYPIRVGAFDLTGNGVPEVLVSSELDQALHVFNDVGTGAFETSQILLDSQGKTERMHPADMNGDGREDLLILGDSPSSAFLDGRVSWYTYEGPDYLGKRHPVSNHVLGAVDAIPVDVDGDLDTDVVVASADNTAITWYANNGDGTFTDSVVVDGAIPNPGRIASGDFNGDDIPDLAATTLESGEVRLYLNNGSGAFSATVVHDAIINGKWFAAADMDSDLDTDLVVGYNGEHIGWLENNNGLTDWPLHALNGDFEHLFGLAAGDLNGDGAAEVLYTTLRYQQGGHLGAMYNNGTGLGFLEKQLDDTPIGGADPELLDIDQDGDLDAVFGVVDYGFSDVYFYTWDPADSLTYYDRVSTYTLDPLHVVVSDLSGDGLPDLAYASSSNFSGIRYNIEGYGCIDPTACNFNPEDSFDDGSCCYVCDCNDPDALNFNPLADCNDGSCQYAFSGHVFYDENEDGVWDEGEMPLPFETIDIDNGAFTLITDDFGAFSIVLESGFHFLEVETSDVFPFATTTNPQYKNGATSDVQNLLFGLSNQEPDWDIVIDFYPAGGMPCNEWRNYNICFRNMGNEPLDGVIAVSYDALFQGHEEVTPIDSVDGNTVYMSFENLAPGEMEFYDILLLTPLPDFIGEPTLNAAYAYGYVDDELKASGESIRDELVTCAYDPNDKQAFPLGYTDDHLLLDNTRQEFVVRFQNTGNAPATTVVIRDTLDVNFDLESFELVANTHSVMTSLDHTTREIVFTFNDIQLPDSTCCEPESHGLVSYVVTSKENLDEGTVLHNTAYIYFDNNPPIVTNSTWTTIHKCNYLLNLDLDIASDCWGNTAYALTDYQPLVPALETYSWSLNGEPLSDALQLVLPFDQPVQGTLMWEAHNPLCHEITATDLDLVPWVTDPSCPGDLNCDHFVGAGDMVLFLGQFGCESPFCHYDLDGDGAGTSEDILILLGVFGTQCN